MEHFLIYLLKSGVCLALFYIYTKAFFSNETFFRFNRFMLLTGVVVCFLIPLMKVSVSERIIVQQPFVVMEELLVSERKPVEAGFELPAYSGSQDEPVKRAMHSGTVLWIVFLAGAVINLTFLLKSTYAMLRIIRKGRKRVYSGQTLVTISHNITPFSWGKYIVLSEDDYTDNPDEIICHEQAHIRHFHFIDILFVEFLLLFQWFNPAMWLLVSELKEIHEYQADRSVLQSGIDAKKYQLLLVKKAAGANSYILANRFNHSKIKKRITMMLKEKSNRWARLKLLLLLPLGIFSVYAFARTEVNKRNVNESVDLFTAYESNHFEPDIQEMPGKNEIALPEHQDPVKQNQTINTFIMVSGKEGVEIKSISPENTESMTILKDQSAVGQYGEKSKNGIARVTLKNNPSGKIDCVLIFFDGEKIDDALLIVDSKRIDDALIIVDGKEVVDIIRNGTPFLPNRKTD